MDIYKEQAKKFLQSNFLAEIATVTPGGEPQVATIFYVMDDDFNFYFVTRRSSRKYANLANNNKVGMVVTSEKGPETVQIQGEVDSSFKDIYKFIAILGTKVDLFNLYYGPFLKLTGLDFQVFKVTVHWLRLLNLQEGADVYHQIIPDFRLVEENKENKKE